MIQFLMTKRLMFTGAVACLGAALPFGGVAYAQTKAGSQMADDVFKNIQVLKGLTVDEFMGTMGLFSAALNVCCGDCHVGAGGSDPQWDKDVPRKQTARQMIAMVNTINKTNFGGAQMVTCWTCHRGSGAPATTPGIDAIYSDPVPSPPDILPQATTGTVVAYRRSDSGQIHPGSGRRRQAGEAHQLYRQRDQPPRLE